MTRRGEIVLITGCTSVIGRATAELLEIDPDSPANAWNEFRERRIPEPTTRRL